MVSSSLVRSRAIAVLLPMPQSVHGTGSLVSFIENAHIAILASDSKLSFWAAWTVMNNCRSQFGWHSAQLKERAISRVVERQVTPDLPDHVVPVPPLFVPPWLVPPWLVPPLLVPPLLVPPLLVPPLLVPPSRLLAPPLLFFRRWFRCRFVFMRWYRWCNVNRIAFAIFWIALGSFVFARCGG